MRFIIFSLFLISLVSCKSKYIPKVRVWPPSVYPAMAIDTTYHFTEMIKDGYGYHNYIIHKIPNKLLEAKLTGQIEFYANINNKGQIVNLNIQSMFIKKNGRKFIRYDNKLDKKEPTKKSYYTIKNYIQEASNSFEKITANKVTDTLHPTYCVISLKE